MNSPNFWFIEVSTNERISVLPSLVFVWPSNCGLAQPHRDDRGETLAAVLADERCRPSL